MSMTNASFVSAAEKKTYEDQGFVVIRNLINTSLSSKLYRATVQLCHKYDSSFALEMIDLEAWVDPTFNSELRRFRTESPESFGGVYDSLQNSAVLREITCNSSTIAVATKLLGEQCGGGLANTGSMLRMDAPQDTRNTLAWHQESFYYEQNLGGNNGTVLWFPLHDMTEKHGCPYFCSQSHLQGKLVVGESNKNSHGFSEQFHVPESELEKYDEHCAVLDYGEAIFFQMDTLHRSGHNSTKDFRFSAGARFHRMLADDFLPGRDIYSPSRVGRLIDRG